VTETLFNTSLWGDEAFSAVACQKPFFAMMQVVFKDTSPPLMYLIMWTWFRIFGSSEIAIRSLSLLFYLGTTLVVYLIGKKLFDSKTGIIASLLTFFNPFLFPYAFEGRMYFCLLFFVVLSFYFLVSEKKTGYILSAAAALYCHHFAILAVLSQFIWQTTQIKKPISKNIPALIKPYLLIALLYLPWLYPLYQQTKLVAGGFWLGKPELKDLAGIFHHFLTHKLVIKAQNFIIVLAAALLALRKWQKKQIGSDLFLLTWAIVPALLAFLISQTKLSIFYERYLLYSVPPIMLILASRTRKISIPLLALMLLIFITVSWHYFTHPFKKTFREFAGWIKTNVSPDTFIANHNGASHHLWETKYYGIEAPIYVPEGELPFFVGTAQMGPEDILRQLPEDRPIGLISSDDPGKIAVRGYWITGYRKIDSLYFVNLIKEQ